MCVYLCFLHHADFGSLLKIQDVFFSYERLVDFQRSHCELLREKIYKMKSKVRGLQNELSETKEVKSVRASESKVGTRPQQFEVPYISLLKCLSCCFV